MYKIRYILIALLVSIGLLAFANGERLKDKKSVEVTQQESVQLFDLQGRAVNLNDYIGKKSVFLNFFTTWCPACISERPDIELLSKVMKDKDIEILAVDLQESKSKVLGFMKKNNYTFTVLLDEKGILAREFGVRSIPTTVLLDRQGKIVDKFVGGVNWNTPKNLKMLESLIN